MDYITTTQLRTKSSELVSELKKGKKVSLIHRSKVVGKIEPTLTSKPLTKEGIKQLKKLAKELNLPQLSYKERERRYRKHMEEKYGQGLSRH